MLFSSVALAGLLAASGAKPGGGRLCYVKSGERVDSLAVCTNTTGPTSASVPPLSTVRTFLWIRGDGKEATIGRIPSGETKVDLASGRNLPVPKISESDEDAWQAVSVELLGPSGPIAVELPASLIPDLRTLRGPADIKEIHLTARHYFPEAVILSSKTPPRIWIRRLPSISGKVIDGDTSVPIDRANISATRLSSTKTDAAGRFRLEIAGEWPAHIEVSSRGKGTADIELPPARPNIQLPVITLHEAGSLIAGLIHSTALRAEIARVGSNGEHVVAQRNVTADDTELRVKDLSAGTYTLHLIGPGPLQHFVHTFQIHTGQETYADIMLAARTLDIAVRHGGDPVNGASIDVMHTSPKWQATLTADGGGRITEEFWQGGNFGLVVSSTGLPGYFTTKKAPDNDSAHWTVELPTRRVHGTIVDEETKSPVAKADVGIQIITNQGDVQLHTLSGADGMFTFEAIPAGDELLNVRARGFVRKEAAHRYQEGEEDIKIDVTLTRAVPIVLVISRPNGGPASGALVVDGSQPENGELIADPQGRCEVSLSPGAKSTLFVIPPDGSFAVVHVDPDAGPGVVNVTVPEGSATIRFEAVADGPVPVVNLLIRYNNQMILPHVIDAFLHAQGNLFRIASGVGLLERMPPGVYEIWPLFNEARIPELAMTESRARVVIRPGENVVTLEFARK